MGKRIDRIGITLPGLECAVPTAAASPVTRI
jgi:hypothetical protein